MIQSWAKFIPQSWTDCCWEISQSDRLHPPPPHPLSSHHGSSPLPPPSPSPSPPPYRIPTSRFYRVVIHSTITRCAVLAQRVGWIMLQHYCSIFCWKPSFYVFISMETLDRVLGSSFILRAASTEYRVRVEEKQGGVYLPSQLERTPQLCL